ncbi:hypothetical protein F-VV10_0092 [Faustovirus]|nr:hypothetical protein F-VV10_0092 [Faustovirus]
MSTTFADTIQAYNITSVNNIYIGSISGTPTGCLVTGANQTLNGTFSVNIAGSSNSIGGTEGITRSYMIGGMSNTIDNSGVGSGTVINAGMLGCDSCTMGTTVRSRSCIINSTTVSMSSTGSTNTVVGVNVGTLGGSSSSGNILAGGSSQTISTSGTSTDCAIVGGLTNSITTSSRCSILGGNGNIINNSTSGSITNSSIISSLTGNITNSVAGYTMSGNAIIGGEDHNITNRVTRTCILGGFDNTISTSGTGQIFNSCILGGSVNQITSSSSGDSGRNVILGGTSHTITASGAGIATSSTIAYGSGCTLTNNASCLIGGTNATVTSGLSGIVNLTCSNTTAFNAGTSNVFHARFSGGYYFTTNAAGTNGVNLTANDSDGWSSFSDIRMKNIHREISYGDVLNGLDEVHVYNYNYKHDPEDAAIKLGCVAQEFHGVYADKLGIIKKGVTNVKNINDVYGTDDDPVQAINSANLAYISLACIKALKAEIEDLKAEIAELKSIKY